MSTENISADNAKIVLNNIGKTALYVIRQDSHEILFFNENVKRTMPDVEIGKLCHDVWAGYCDTCPLNDMKGDTNTTVSYNDPNFPVADLTATKCMWDGKIPAYVVTVTPHNMIDRDEQAYHNFQRLDVLSRQLIIAASKVYSLIIPVNLTKNTYELAEYENFINKLTDKKGTFDSLVESGATKIPKNERASFVSFFLRSNLLAIRSSGKTSAILEHQMCDNDGILHWMSTQVLFVDDPYGHDVLLVVLCMCIDDQKKLEQRLIDERNAVYDSIPGEVVKCRMDIANKKLVIIEASKKYKTTSEKESYIDFDSVHPSDKKKLVKDCWRAVSAGKPFVFEYRRESVGDIKWEHARGQKIGRTGEGDPIYVMLLMDITQRIRAQEEIVLEREKYRIAVESSADVIYEYFAEEDRFVFQDNRDPGGDDRIVNSMLEYTTEHVHPEDLENILGLMHGDMEKAEVRLSLDGGDKYLRYLVQSNPIYNGGDIVRIVGTMRDITALHDREETFRSRERLLNASIITLFGELIVLNLKTGDFTLEKNNELTDKIPPVNDFRIFNTYYGQNFVHPSDRQKFFATFSFDAICKAVADGKNNISAELRRLTETGEWHWCELIGSTIDKDFMLLTFRDIDELRQERDRQKEALRNALTLAEQANAAKSDFLSRMSHDIRTPMNAIIGMTAIASSVLDGHDESVSTSKIKLSDCISKINTSSKYLLSLINDILDMSKIESGKLSITNKSFDLHDLLQNVASFGITQASIKNQKFTLNVSAAVEEHYAGDSLRINQVLMNLLSNALKYTQNGGEISLNVDVTAVTSKHVQMTVNVVDNGLGMTPEFLDRVFEPFEQELSFESRNGSGLGLAITQNLVHLMGGEISVKSKFGYGSEFVVKIPLERIDKAEDDFSMEDVCVLVLDDEDWICEQTCNILEKMGVETISFNSGKAALEYLEKAVTDRLRIPDVLLIDWKMPKMDGVETVRCIRSLIGPDVLILIASSYDWSEIEVEARNAGVDLFLSKPILAGNLRAVLTSAARERKERHFSFDGQRVLLVEDNELNIEIAKTLLEMHGLIVDVAINGREAVERFTTAEDNTYFAVLMDIQMPIMNGYEATKAIRASKHPEAKIIPIIAMTANAFLSDIEQSLRSGMNAHIAKPIDIGNLLKLLHRFGVKNRTK